jgi:DNA ligase 1
MKPMLAEDFVESKLRFPLCAQPKIDGVRGINFHGAFVGRSLRPHANQFTTRFYSQLELSLLDGEVAAAHECDPSLCRKTVSALNTIAGEPFTLWWLFDDLRSPRKPYVERYHDMCDRVTALQKANWLFAGHLRIVPSFLVSNMDELASHEAKWLEQGYEGVIIRDPHGLYKEGRSTPREGGLLRIKRFTEEDATVLAVQEGQVNLNPATVNALGRTERSTHQENMVPNGMVGALLCKCHKTDKEIVVSAGAMTHDERKMYFDQPHLIVGKVIKYKSFMKGVKDLPRFPNFVSLRMASDSVR